MSIKRKTLAEKSTPGIFVVIMKTTIITFILMCSLIEHGYTQNSKCGIEKFECANGQCIESTLLCDGRADCRDKSDETSAVCTRPEITCPDYAFRCSYGACVDGDAACNGVKDCIDNSDETLIRCNRSSSHNVPPLCANNGFKCNNNQCIDSVDICDGTADCVDGSDETFILCGSIICPVLSFRCNYGGCIDGDLKCNGAINCVDGSDEDPALCRITTTPETPIYRPTSTPTKAPPPLPPVTPTLGSKFCTVPSQPVNGYWKLHKSQCCNVEYGESCDHCDAEQGTRVNPGGYLIYNCNSGYKIRGPKEVFCNLNGKFVNIPVCTEIRCRSLESPSMFADCTYDDEYVSCLTPALPRTVARLTCRTSYRPNSMITSRSRVKCDKNGQWDPEPIQCIPVCGVPPLNTVPLIVGGTRANISEFAWHATLYKSNPAGKKDFICGATIIHAKLLITAAHCVYNENTKRLQDPSNFYIATGNVYRDYDTPFHTPIVKKAQVKDIYIVCTYFGNEGNYAADIAILEITQPFVFSALLVPICLDFSNTEVILESGIKGKVAGFGRTAMGSSSFILQTLTVPYIPFNQCRSLSAVYETQKYITEDKFCAGYTNGSSVCDGDSGGGLVFQSFSGGPWYLKGIVSVSLSTVVQGGTRVCDSYSYSLYTQVSNHMSWIQDIILKIETQKPVNSCPVIY